MTPKAMASLNHFTFPLAIRSASCRVTHGAREHPARHRVGRDRNDTRRKGCQETPAWPGPVSVKPARSIGWRHVQGAVQLPIAQYSAHVAARLLGGDELDKFIRIVGAG